MLAHMHFPKSCWKRIRSTNPLERLNREMMRPTADLITQVAPPPTLPPVTGFEWDDRNNSK